MLQLFTRKYKKFITILETISKFYPLLTLGWIFEWVQVQKKLSSKTQQSLIIECLLFYEIKKFKIFDKPPFYFFLLNSAFENNLLDHFLSVFVKKLEKMVWFGKPNYIRILAIKVANCARRPRNRYKRELKPPFLETWSVITDNKFN